MTCIFGFKKTVINMVLFFDTPLEKARSPVPQKKYGIIVMLGLKLQQRCMNKDFV